LARDVLDPNLYATRDWTDPASAGPSLRIAAGIAMFLEILLAAR
jgi:hypothetical protein